MKWTDYRKQLGLGFSDTQKENLFINRVNIWLSNSYNIPYNEKSEYRFSYEIGHTFLLKCSVKSCFGGIGNYYDFQEDVHNLRRVRYYLNNHQDSIEDLISCLVVLHNTYEGNPIYKDLIYTNIIKILNDCDILYDVRKDDDGVFIFPKGAEELDFGLVSVPLKWLEEYPNSRMAFVKALKIYSNNNCENASEVADMFRKALETFFQEFFNSRKSLENILSDYGLYMKTKNVPADISNNLEKLVKLYTDYMNHYAKHHDNVSQNVLEFIMYQTGNIIRLIITLSK